MQESAPPTSPTRTTRQKYRYNITAITIVSVVLVFLAWPVIAFIYGSKWWILITVASISLSLLLLAKGEVLLLKLKGRAGIEALTCEFNQVSDRFARPKLFKHKVFDQQVPDLADLKKFVYGVSLSSDGEIILPEMTSSRTDYGRNGYTVALCINDDVICLSHANRYISYNTSLLTTFHQKHAGKGEENAHFRITMDDASSKAMGGEFSISGAEFDGFMKTLELAKYYRLTNSR
jgi:hypothetical protein